MIFNLTHDRKILISFFSLGKRIVTQKLTYNFINLSEKKNKWKIIDEQEWTIRKLILSPGNYSS